MFPWRQEANPSHDLLLVSPFFLSLISLVSNNTTLNQWGDILTFKTHIWALQWVKVTETKQKHWIITTLLHWLIYKSYSGLQRIQGSMSYAYFIRVGVHYWQFQSWLLQLVCTHALFLQYAFLSHVIHLFRKT